MCGQTPQQMVREFHETFGLAVNEEPNRKLGTLRINLIQEECDEVTDSLELADLPECFDSWELAKELADLVYVAYGTAVSFGIDLDVALASVHKSNMSKLGEDGKPIVREDGKILKGPNYLPPNMTSALWPRRAS